MKYGNGRWDVHSLTLRRERTFLLLAGSYYQLRHFRTPCRETAGAPVGHNDRRRVPLSQKPQGQA